MRLNTLVPAAGSKKKAQRVGRGIGSGLGKTSGYGHKGQTARSGGTIRPGFEGGQMPLKQRLPKFGFTSRQALVHAEVRLQELALVEGDLVTIETLKAAGVVKKSIKTAKVVASGKLERALTVKGLGLTAGAKAAVEAAGGKVEE